MMKDIKSEKNDTLKRSLSSLVDDSFPEEKGSLLEKPKESEELAPYTPFNHDEKELKVKTRAIKTINSLLKLYLDESVICKNDYIRAKARMDKFNMYQLLLAIEQMEHAIKVLMVDIDTGNSSPRMFEVYGNLQRTRMELLRECNTLMADVEESTKKIKNDIELLEKLKENENSNNSKTLSLNGGGSFVSRGNRELLKQIKEKNKNKETFENGKEESFTPDADIE